MALNLKSASGAGYTFEDKVAALLLAEMLVGYQSLGKAFGPLDQIERISLNLNPFDDLLLTVRDKNGAKVQCACSVKSNQQITAKGCTAELRGNFWTLLRNPAFAKRTNAQIGLFCAQLNSDVSADINALCLQARNENALDHCLADKVSSERQRTILDSFSAPDDTAKGGAPERVLSHFVFREFDFEASVSSKENHGISLCRQSLAPVASADPNPEKLWHELQHIAQELRISGGSIDQAGLVAKLRPLFSLTDDPLDQAVWAPVRQKTQMWLSEINNALPEGLVLPRTDLTDAIIKNLHPGKIIMLVGQSGSGKSAALKSLFEHIASDNSEKVWIKAEKCTALTDEIPAFVDTLKRTRKPTGFLVIDSLDGCFDTATFARIANVVQTLNTSDVPASGQCNTGRWLAGFLRENPIYSLRLIIRLVDFATDRYADWWPYQDSPVRKIEFEASDKKVVWRGNHQIYTWNRSPMKTPNYIGCALMALERWFDETIKENATEVSAVINQIFGQSRSLAFAGVLVSVGKRHRELFLAELKPLLFVKDLIPLDIQTVTQESNFGMGGFNDTLFERKLQAEWYQIPERKQLLRDLCAQWMFQDSRFIPVLKEVSDNWKKEASCLPTEDEQVTLLRWATFLDFTAYKAFKMPDGQVVFQCQLPPELDRTKEAQQSLLNSDKLILPFQCYQQLEKRVSLNDKQFDEDWQRLVDWKATFAESYDQQDASNIEDRTTDPRHAHAGLLAVLVCLGEEHLKKDPSRYDEVVNDVKSLLSNPPPTIVFSEEEHHDDFEAFMARAVVHLWVEEPKCKTWRKAVAEYTTTYRYRTVWHLYNEAFRLRASSGTTFNELEALILAFAAIRQRINSIPPSTQRDYENDKERKQLVSAFTQGKTPVWCDEWNSLEVVGAALPATRGDRSTYRLDMTLLLHTFGHMDSVHIVSCKNIPSLSQAYDIRERRHWINHAVQMVTALIRSMPESFEEHTSNHLLYEEDRNILYFAAIRLLECTDEERQGILDPLLNNLVDEVISALLDGVSLARYHTDPPLMTEFLAVWKTIVFSIFEHQTAIRYTDMYHRHALWPTALLYGVSSFRFSQEIEMTTLTPLVTALKPIYQWFINEKLGMWDPVEISNLSSFLSTQAGIDVRKDVICWYAKKLSTSDTEFWRKVSSYDGLSKLLQSLWAQYPVLIRKDMAVRDAFTALLAPLAANHNRIALTLQQQLSV